MLRSKTKRLNKKILIAVVVAIVVLAGGGFFAWKQRSSTKPESTNQPSGQNIGGINYGPPTDEEKQAAEENKQNLTNQPNKENTQPSNPSTQPASNATVVLTSATYSSQAVQASGFISNVFEEGGTCTLTLTMGAYKVTGTSLGFTDVNKTTCPPISIKRSQLAEAGDWTAVLSYSSKTKSGSSSPTTVKVQ